MAQKTTAPARTTSASAGPAKTTKPAAEDKQLVHQPTSASPLVRVQEPVPEYLKDLRGRHDGLEGTDQSDFVIPRLGLCQALSPQRKRSDSKYIPGLEEGQFFNTVTGRIYGDSVLLIPLFVAKNRIKFLEPIGTGIDCMAIDGKTGTKYGVCSECKFAQFQEKDPPECTEFKGWVSLVEGEPIGLSLKSTSLKVAKQLNSMIRMRNLPAYAQIFKATSVDETKQGNTYKQWVIQPAGFTPQEFIASAREYFDALRAQGVRIDTEGAEAEEAGDPEFDTAQM